ncbi:MAG TPA: HTTM domain-containing protein [Chryseolinea sp.]|nr:HTTM domain-containing protein [Chryseolinea sp.]
MKPMYFFSFYGFEFVKPLGNYTYIIFLICAIACLLVMLGLFYRVAITTLFLSFTYIELMDKSTYLNHYYFISMVCLLMIFLPSHATFSLDAKRDKTLASKEVPRWSIDVIKLFVCMVYVFAGLAKINSDWLLHAQPLRIWLPAKNDLPVIGFLFNKVWVAFAFCWIGCLYDLCVPFLLLNRKTRLVGFSAVVIFHTFTAILFPIGMFPYIMIGISLIFFSSEFHEQLIGKLKSLFERDRSFESSEKIYVYPQAAKPFLMGFFAIFFFIQVILPMRYLLYPDELFWTEEGYRFSWRVMLMEKAGYTEFVVKDEEGNKINVNNKEFLIPLQEKMMATQPDMILQYAHMLRDHYLQHGIKEPQVYVDSYVALNGRLGKLLIDPTVNLSKETESFRHKNWILPSPHEISGL